VAPWIGSLVDRNFPGLAYFNFPVGSELAYLKKSACPKIFPLLEKVRLPYFRNLACPSPVHRANSQPSTGRNDEAG